MTVESSQIKKFARDLFERPVQADNEASADPLTNSIPDTENKLGSTDTNGDLPF